MKPRVIRLFLDADLRCQHLGLKRLAKKNRVNLDALGSNEHCVFVNSQKTKVKVYSGNQVLSYFSNGSRRVRLDVVNKIMGTFGGNIAAEYRKTLKETLIRELGK